MSSDVRGWFNLPKSVKLLDISIIGYIISLVVAFLLYYFILDQTIQNLMPIFLVAILLLFTWNFRSKLVNSSSADEQKHYFREWIIICSLVILVIIVLILLYPVTY
jgi:hypothetical protein